VLPCSLSATYTNPSSVSKLLLEDEKAAELYSFLVLLRSLNIEKVSSRMQQKQLEIAKFQIRPLFIGTGNEPIKFVLFLCDCCDKLSFTFVLCTLVMSRQYVETLTRLNICGIPNRIPCYVMSFSLDHIITQEKAHTCEASSVIRVFIAFSFFSLSIVGPYRQFF
jgi:hypothetical protein